MKKLIDIKFDSSSFVQNILKYTYENQDKLSDSKTLIKKINKLKSTIPPYFKNNLNINTVEEMFAFLSDTNLSKDNLDLIVNYLENAGFTSDDVLKLVDILTLSDILGNKLISEKTDKIEENRTHEEEPCH